MAQKENPNSGLQNDGAATLMTRLKSHHTRAFDCLSAALDLDEDITRQHPESSGNDDDSLEAVAALTAKLQKLVELYRSGVSELRRGLALRCDASKKDADQETVAVADKFHRLQAKMRENLGRAEERLDASSTRLRDLKRQQQQQQHKGQRSVRAPASSSRNRAGGGGICSGGSSSSSSSKPRSTSSCSAAATAAAAAAQSQRRLQPPTANQLKGIDTSLAHSILNEVLDQSPGVAFDDVIGNESAKGALREATVLPSLRPDLFSGLRQPARAVLLFGPPGNGKTLLAKAVATEAGCVFFNISAGSLMSKWVGEAEKLVRALFALARQLSPAVIFIDEVDSMLCQRSDKETEVSRRLKTQFLVELDGVCASNGGSGGGGGNDGSASSAAAAAKQQTPRVLLLAATNRPAELDSAVVRRFSRRLYVGMPDAAARARLLEALLARHDSVRVSKSELAQLADLTEGYSASDLANLAREAAMEPLRQIRPDRLATVAKAAVRPLVAADLRACLARIRPSVPAESLAELLDWNAKYGDGSSFT